jgi:hypothetical protein
LPLPTVSWAAGVGLACCMTLAKLVVDGRAAGRSVGEAGKPELACRVLM